MADDINSIPEILRYRSEHDGEVKAFSFYDRDGFVASLNSQEIYTLSGKFASRLRDSGFNAGDVIANGLPNSPERVITDFGVIMAGCVLANCQVIEKDGSDFWNSARLSQCQGLIICHKKENPCYKLVSSFLPDNTTCNSGTLDVAIQQAPSIRKVILVDRCGSGGQQHSFLESTRTSDTQVFEAECSPSSLAVLFGTSGSSGFSKLIPQTHERVLDNGRKFRASESAIYFTDRPMGWIGGFPFDFLAFGSKRVVQDKFDNKHTETPEGLWRIISTARCTGAGLLPATVYELEDHYRDKPPDYKLQFITSSGQAMKKELVNAIGLLCHAVVVSYGSSEGGMFSFDLITNPDQFKDFYCGKVMQDVQVKIVDEEGNDLEYGQEGEIYLKCGRLVKQYYNKMETVNSGPSNKQGLSNMYTSDGWFRTEDRGLLQSDNSLFCFGRRGDVVTIGPILLYLSWPENILNKCPDVQNSSIIGFNDETTGNVELCACVIPKVGRQNLSETEVMQFYDSQIMDTGGEFRPSLSHVLIMDNLPLLPSGKTHKRKLKELVKEKLKAL